ncbi:MAG TPA: hypothetical protein VK131_00615, partial [Candidatus Acidoferrales bacterium]|nr:hypothetical protein [Candidatus Acidoferrales bacterium]
AQGALGDLLYQTLVFPGRALPVPLRYKVFQNLPEVFRGTNLALFVFVLAMVGLAAWSRRGWVRAAAALAIPAAVLAHHLYPSDFWGRFLAEALGLLLVLNGAALVLALARRDLPFPPELPALALALQYLAQFTFSGVWYSYLGAYLSVPVALLLLRWLAGELRWAGALAPALAGGWLAAGSVLFLAGSVYRDAPRPQLTAAFHSAKLAGIRSTPADVERVDGMVAEVERDSRPGEPILAFPDFPGLYFLTGRRNPTRQDWYNRGTLTPEVADQAAAELARNPPRVVFVQTYAEWDFLRTTPPLDYESDPKFAPVYRFIVANYVQTGAIGDILVYRPRASSSR